MKRAQEGQILGKRAVAVGDEGIDPLLHRQRANHRLQQSATLLDVNVGVFLSVLEGIERRHAKFDQFLLGRIANLELLVRKVA